MVTEATTESDVKKQKSLGSLEIGDRLSHVVRVESVEFKDNSKKPWLLLKLGDSTSTAFAKKWGATTEEYEKYKDVKYAIITGLVQNYEGRASIVLDSFLPNLPFDFSEEDRKALDFIGTPPRPKPSRETMFLAKTKQEVNFDVLIKTQKPLKELTPGDEVEHIVRISSHEIKKAKTTFVLFYVADASGTMTAKQWDTDEETVKIFDNAKAVYVKGVVDRYEPKNGGSPQIQIKYDQLSPIIDATDLDANPLFMTTTYPVKELKLGLWKIIKEIKNPHVKTLCESLIKDEKNQNFSVVPAGLTKHHSWRNGLLEHTFRLINFIDDYIILYDELLLNGKNLKLNRDIIVAGALYHDFFKCHEYTIDCKYAPRGNLIKHLSRGIFDISVRTSKIENFPKRTETILSHIISAHHKLKEWDTLDTAACPEALIVHFFDDLCSKLESTIYELNRLSEGEQYTANRVPSINNTAFMGSCTYDTYRIFPIVNAQIKADYGRAELEIAIRSMIADIKDDYVRYVCDEVLALELNSFKNYPYSNYKYGLLEFTYRTMFSVANFTNSFNQRNWPQNRIFLNPDFIVAGSFLQNYFKFRSEDPISGEISSFITSLGKIVAKKDAFPIEVVELLGQIVASQDEDGPENISCPESIVNHYIRDITYLLDHMVLTLSELPCDQWETADKIELFGKKINKGTCSEMGN